MRSLKLYPPMKVVDSVEEAEDWLLEKWGYQELWVQILLCEQYGLLSLN